jgi:hypothetical protein
MREDGVKHQVIRFVAGFSVCARQEGLKRIAMSNDDMQKESKNLQGDLSKEGLTCFEVVGLAQDRDLIIFLAQQLSADSAEASNLRIVIDQAIRDNPKKRGGILASLLNSPLVGADGEIDLSRPVVSGRPVDL